MAFAGLTALSDSDLVTDEERSRLSTVGITTVEELASAIRDDAASVAGILKKPLEQVRTLGEQAEDRLDDSMRAAFDAPSRRYATGALPPGGHSQRR